VSGEELESCVALLCESVAFRSKGDIARVARCIDAMPAAVGGWQPRSERILVGDDAAAIPDGDGYVLLAAEAVLPEFLDRDPYFAGWSSVMVNVSDIAAMGGWPLAVVDVYVHATSSPVEAVIAGMRAASEAYGAPLVGGHTTRREGGAQVLSVAIVGRATHLLTSFEARAGDLVLFAGDLRGGYRGAFPFWNATEGRAGASLRDDLATFQALAARQFVHACKDVSNAGVAGTLLMMLEASGVGGVLDLDRLPRPTGVPLARWLLTFPSFGFLLSVATEHADAVKAQFRGRGLTCEEVGSIDASSTLRLASGRRERPLWDLAERPFTGFRGRRGTGP
jgi:uncharacterized protein